MFTPTSDTALTSSEIEYLLSLPDSDLEAFLKAAGPALQPCFLRQLGAATGLKVKAEPGKLPISPTPRQSDFLALTCREALYGGAAGGGKSEALLMWLAQGIHLPDYSAIIFRRTYKQLIKSNDSLWVKARRLFTPLGAIGNKTDKQWKFPTGALIEMGALEHEDSVEDYQGNSYHRVAYDELTHFSRDQYEYLANSRIRKPPGYPIALGVRSGSNPGGIGHDWVKRRFITDEALEQTRGFNATDPSPPGTVYYTPEGRAFVPARVADNPFVDLQDYVESLSRFENPVTRERLMNGDWSIMPEGLIKPEWLRYFTMQGQIIRLHNQAGSVLSAFDERECMRFSTVDTAGSAKDKTRESKGRPHSWSVAGVWDYKRLGTMSALICRHVWRGRVGFVEMCNVLRGIHRDWRPASIKVEDATMGPDLQNLLKHEIPIGLVATGGKDKVTRATDLLNMLSLGQVFLPQHENSWRTVLEAEWLSWQGLEEETNDQIDMAAYAAAHARPLAHASQPMAFDGPFIARR